nr:hypothetical protein BaRGS_014522 [Batillaria attramentaria]
MQTLALDIPRDEKAPPAAQAATASYLLIAAVNRIKVSGARLCTVYHDMTDTQLTDRAANTTKMEEEEEKAPPTGGSDSTPPVNPENKNQETNNTDNQASSVNASTSDLCTDNSGDAMIATNIPTAAHNNNSSDFINMSGNVSDDGSEVGSRLYIDDGASGGSLTKTPTRSGNIQNRTYVCGKCDFTSTAAKAYLHHQKDLHDPTLTIYECDICDYATKYKQKLPRHRKLHFIGTDSMLNAGQVSDTTNTSLAIPATSASSASNGPVASTSAISEVLNGPPQALPATVAAVREGNLPPVIVDDGDEDEGEENSKGSGSPPPDIMEIPDMEPPEKKKKTRQEVDPAKYFEVFDESGIKFACSNCGNVYKWRKSLNKHWKEKHNGETPDNSKYPAGGRRRMYHNQLLEKITVNEDEDQGDLLEEGASMASAHSSPPPETPQNFLNGSYSGGSHGSDFQDGIDSAHFLPNVIGPFVGSSQPVFPGSKQLETLTASLNGPIPSHSALDLSQRSSPMDETDSIDTAGGMQSEPLNLAMRNNHALDLASIKREQPWDESMDDVDSAMDDDSGEANHSASDNASQKGNVLKCKKCPFVAKTVVDYSAHMTLHFNKRVFKCAACHKHFEQIPLLNDHFAAQHADLITAHKLSLQHAVQYEQESQA